MRRSRLTRTLRVANSISDWRDLPFREIWLADFEFYPGAGLANGGREGDPSTPLCLVALEMRSGRIVRQWRDDFGRFPPYRLDADALFVSYMLSAEYGCHIALGWGQPACALDPYIEFRHHVNDGAVKGAERQKGFYSLAGALQYFRESGIDTAHKTDMRDRIVQGPPYTTAERAEILNYCESDIHALALLVAHIIPTIRSLPHAMLRAKFMWTVAQQERRGLPVDIPLVTRLRSNWDGMQGGLVAEMDTPFGVYEFDENGKPHWRKHLFANYVRRNGMLWPAYPDGSLDERDQTFREMQGRYPQIGPLRELKYSVSKLRLNALQIGNDGRNRTLLGPYGSKTGRNQPSNSKYIFGPATWLRFLITPPPGRVLVHRDYTQQEVRVAAIRSGDPALLEICQSGEDIYLGMAKQLGFAPEDATPETHVAVRFMFKTVVLGILYGLGAHSLMLRTGASPFEAGEILARLRARFCVFEDYVLAVADRAGLHLELSTPLGWVMQCPPGINPRTLRNYPIQSTAAEIMHVVCILAERRGIPIVASVHDAFMVEVDLDQADEASAALDRVMRDAAAVVLGGYELPTDFQIIRPGERYYEKRGKEMWATVNRLLAKLEARSA
jgi:DNA polymerase-1